MKKQKGWRKIKQGGFAKYYNEETKKDKVSMARVMHGSKEKSHRVLVGKPEGRKPLDWPRLRWEDIKVDLEEASWGGCGMDSW